MFGMGGSSCPGDRDVGRCEGDGVERAEAVSESAPSSCLTELFFELDNFALVSAAASSIVPEW